MFDSADYGGTDLLFKDSTIQLLELAEGKKTYEGFLGEEYLKSIQAVNCDSGAGVFRGSLMLMALSVLIVLGLK